MLTGVDINPADIPTIMPAETHPVSLRRLSSGGVDLGNNSHADRALFAGRAAEVQRASVLSVRPTGFWIGPETDRIFVAFGEAGAVPVNPGDHLTVRGVFRTAPNDPAELGLNGDEQKRVAAQHVYIHALTVTKQEQSPE